jgi:hypothetical protein
MKESRVKKFQYEGFGFPIILLDVPVKSFRGVEVPDIDFNALQRVVLKKLDHKPSPLTGKEVRFIRQSLKMTYTEFAKHFGLTRASVIKREKAS